MIDARAHVDLRASDIELLTVHVHPDSAAVVCDASRDLKHPASPYAAKFPLPWSVAALVVDGHLDLATFQDASLLRPDVTALACRVDWQLAPAPLAAADAPGRMQVGLRDGRRIVGSVARSRGGSHEPMSSAALRAKFDANVGGLEAGFAELAASIGSLGTQPM